MIETRTEPPLAVLALLVVLAGAGCDARRDEPSGASETSGQHTTNATAETSARERARDAGPDLRALGDRAHALRRERDGPGCLRVLDEIAAASGATTRDGGDEKRDSMAWTRAVCELLAGRCEEGHARLVTYHVEQAGKTRRQARNEANQQVLRWCPTSIGHWAERFHRLDFQSGEAWQRKDGDWCRVQLTDLERALGDAGKDIDQESRGRARRARRLLRQCVARTGRSRDAGAE